MANYIHEQSVLNVLRCGEYNTITERVKLWNKTVISDYSEIYLRLPDNHVNHFSIDSVLDINNSLQETKEVSLDSLNIENVWIIIPKSELSLSTGNHTLKVVLDDIWSKNKFIYYASYIIQDDDPDKPYVYLHKKESISGDTDNDSSDSDNEDNNQ